MINSISKLVDNQRGSVINVALLILILIFLIGIGLHKISTTDIKIASNLKTQTTTFYEAEAALEGASEVLEQNIACPTGFKDKIGTGTDGLPNNWENIEGVVVITDLDFWRNDKSNVDDPVDGNLEDVLADPANVVFNSPYIHAYFPPDYDGSEEMEHTNISIGGVTRFTTGSAIQMAAGYEGLGKGAAAGGATMAYDILVRRYGAEGSAALHTIQWNHILGLGGSCKYN
jgi:hypothetical protein